MEPSVAARHSALIGARHELVRAPITAERRVLVDRLDEELAAIAAGRVDLTKSHAAAVTWFNGLRSDAQLRKELQRDPLSLASAPRQVITTELAAALLAFRDRQRGGRIAGITDLRVVAGVTDSMLRDIIYTGTLRIRLPLPAPAAASIIGVLLPARLETRFDPPAGAGRPWHLRLRVVPDEPWLDAHDPVPTAVELDSVERMWRRAGGGDLTTDVGGVAWGEFVSAHGGGRSVWLARSFPPVANPDGTIGIVRPDEPRTDISPTRLSGFPSAIEVWIGRAGAAPALAARLDVDPNGLELFPGDPDDPTQERWWQSWDRAVAVGLAVDIDIGPASPEDIDVLYVVGLGGEPPAALFADHRDSGRLALLQPGTPTNTVDGEPAADLGNDPTGWLPLVTGPGIGAGAARLGETLAGDAAALGPLPGDSGDQQEIGRLLVTALWQPVWGHMLKDIWGLGPPVNRAGLWAAENVFPAGPLPTVRIGSQPYGVLPVTSLAGWTAAGGDPETEAILAGPLAVIRDRWAELAEAAGTIDGADTDRFLTLVGRTPTSTGFAWRHFVPAEILLLLLWNLGEGVTAAELNRLWDDLARPAVGLVGPAERRYYTVSSPEDLDIPLVVPTNLPPGTTLQDAVAVITGAAPALLTQDGWWEEVFRSRELPNSLLFRLLVLAMILSAAEAARAATASTPEAVLEPVTADDATPTALARDARAFTQAHLALPTAEAAMYAAARDSARRLVDYPVELLERAMRATLDTASHRIDPFVTAFAWRRLQRLRRGNVDFALGVYGWVERPYRGSPGPSAGGLLHAPSDAQALTAAILRDKAINDVEPARWNMDVTSTSARLAEQLAEHVRLGAHPSEAVGREIERIAGDPTRVQQLREQFPIHDQDEGRRVCDGTAILVADPATLPLTAGQLTALQSLRDALDVYGDLLVAGAVHDVVSGRGAVAGSKMDAAVGLARPPDLSVLHTPRPGRSVSTTVAVAVPPAAAPPMSWDGSPATVADPSVAAFAAARFGDGVSAAWSWELDDGRATVTVTLDDVGLSPIDTVVLSADALHRLVESHGPPGAAVTSAAGSATHDRVRRLMDVLGSQPATAGDLAGGPVDDTAERAELRDRYQRLLDVAGLLEARLTLAASAGADVATRDGALRAARRWGITPLDADDPDQQELCVRARAALAGRVAGAPGFAAVAPLDVRSIARAIAELAAPEGNLAILGRVDLGGLGPFTLEVVDATSGINGLDAAWLNVVGAVRAPLARLELHQLEATLDGATAPLAAWTDRPGDPWQELEPAGPDGRPPPSRLTVIYGPDGVLSGSAVAIGLVDQWAEVVPDVEQLTSAAFGFNGPAARAPQAILVAVPPDEAAPLDEPILVGILEETRRLARARMVTPADIGEWSAIVPTAMLPGAGSTAVPLGGR